MADQIGPKTPEEFLQQPLARPDEKGYLKIFLGYASGVGKSFRMLDEARRRKARGQDVVVAAIQPQISSEVEALLGKLEVIPLRNVDGSPALDVDAVIERHPAVCFIDGLAYNNPPGCRNATRWEDARELEQAGIKVIASINIQYIAELREQVEAITGKRVSETVPISFIRSADEIEIIDAPPVEVRDGEQAGAEHRQQKLLRLREMALVLTAEVVDQQLTTYLESHGIRQHFGTQERILVCVTACSPVVDMIETGQIVAKRFYGELIVVNVDQPEISSVDRATLDQKLAYARGAGARVQILHGRDPIDTILEFARSRGLTQIFVGHTHRSRFVARAFGTKVDRLVRLSRGMDVRIFPNRKPWDQHAAS